MPRGATAEYELEGEHRCYYDKAGLLKRRTYDEDTPEEEDRFFYRPRGALARRETYAAGEPDDHGRLPGRSRWELQSTTHYEQRGGETVPTYTVDSLERVLHYDPSGEFLVRVDTPDHAASDDRLHKELHRRVFIPFASGGFRDELVDGAVRRRVYEDSTEVGYTGDENDERLSWASVQACASVQATRVGDAGSGVLREHTTQSMTFAGESGHERLIEASIPELELTFRFEGERKHEVEVSVVTADGTVTEMAEPRKKGGQRVPVVTIGSGTCSTSGRRKVYEIVGPFAEACAGRGEKRLLRKYSDSGRLVSHYEGDVGREYKVRQETVDFALGATTVTVTDTFVGNVPGLEALTTREYAQTRYGRKIVEYEGGHGQECMRVMRGFDGSTTLYEGEKGSEYKTSTKKGDLTTYYARPSAGGHQQVVYTVSLAAGARTSTVMGADGGTVEIRLLPNMSQTGADAITFMHKSDGAGHPWLRWGSGGGLSIHHTYTDRVGFRRAETLQCAMSGGVLRTHSDDNQLVCEELPNGSCMFYNRGGKHVRTVFLDGTIEEYDVPDRPHGQQPTRLKRLTEANGDATEYAMFWCMGRDVWDKKTVRRGQTTEHWGIPNNVRTATTTMILSIDGPGGTTSFTYELPGLSRWFHRTTADGLQISRNPDGRRIEKRGSTRVRAVHVDGTTVRYDERGLPERIAFVDGRSWTFMAREQAFGTVDVGDVGDVDAYVDHVERFPCAHERDTDGALLRAILFRGSIYSDGFLEKECDSPTVEWRYEGGIGDERKVGATTRSACEIFTGARGNERLVERRTHAHIETYVGAFESSQKTREVEYEYRCCNNHCTPAQERGDPERLHLFEGDGGGAAVETVEITANRHRGELTRVDRGDTSVKRLWRIDPLPPVEEWDAATTTPPPDVVITERCTSDAPSAWLEGRARRKRTYKDGSMKLFDYTDNTLYEQGVDGTKKHYCKSIDPKYTTYCFRKELVGGTVVHYMEVERKRPGPNHMKGDKLEKFTELYKERVEYADGRVYHHAFKSSTHYLWKTEFTDRLGRRATNEFDVKDRLLRVSWDGDVYEVITKKAKSVGDRVVVRMALPGGGYRYKEGVVGGTTVITKEEDANGAVVARYTGPAGAEQKVGAVGEKRPREGE